MIVKIDKSLQKDLKKINDQSVKSTLANTILNIQNVLKPTDIQNIKKLKGTKNFYRVRLGNYRLGMIIEGEEVILVRLLHRKDIYKFFP